MATPEPVAAEVERLGEELVALAKKEAVAWRLQVRLLVPPAAFLAVFFAVALRVREGGDLAFYRTAATVIPTLLLTLAIQARFFRLSAVPRSPLSEAIRAGYVTREIVRDAFGVRFWFTRFVLLYARWLLITPRSLALRSILALLAVVGGGEAAAFYAIAFKNTNRVLLGVVAGSMTAMLIAIGTVALFGELSENLLAGTVDDEAVRRWGALAVEIARRRSEGDSAVAVETHTDAAK